MNAATAVMKTERWLSHVCLLIQSVFVVLLFVLGIAAGPIARFSVGSGFVIKDMQVPGTMATVDHNNIQSALVKWNLTINRLNAAGFPYTELLDFLILANCSKVQASQASKALLGLQ